MIMNLTGVCQIVVLYAIIGFAAAIPSAMELFNRVKRDDGIGCGNKCGVDHNAVLDDLKLKYADLGQLFWNTSLCKYFTYQKEWEGYCKMKKDYFDCIAACQPSAGRSFLLDYEYPEYRSKCSITKGVSELAEPKQCLMEKCETVDNTCKEKCKPNDKAQPTPSPDIHSNDFDVKRRAVAALANLSCPQMLCQGECIFKEMQKGCNEARLVAPLIHMETGLRSVTYCHAAMKDACLSGAAGVKHAISGHPPIVFGLFVMAAGLRGFGGREGPM